MSNDLKCLKHPDAGTHYGERTKVIRCNYCNMEVKKISEDELKATPKELKAIKRAEADYKAGRVLTTKQLNKELGLDEVKK